MTKRSMTSLAAIASLLAAGVAVASDTPAPKPAPGQEREVHRVVVTTDGADFGDFDELAWFDGDGEDVFFDGAGDEGGQPGQPGERKVIVRRIGGGPGGMHGMRGGAAQCDDENCDGACGMHGGAGMGPGGHGPGMGMGRGMGMRRGPGGFGGHGPMMFAMLDLSDAQKAKMRDIHEKQARAGIQARADMQLARMDMAKLMRSDNPDQSAINAQVDRMAKMRADMAKSRIATMLEARSVLTAEQRKKFDEMRANGPLGMHGPGGPGGPMMRMMHGPQGGDGPAPTKPKGK